MSITTWHRRLHRRSFNSRCAAITATISTSVKRGATAPLGDRHGEEVRRFAYRQHSLVFHRYRQGPEHHYRYESEQPGARVLEQHNQDGLSYRFDYLDSENAVLVTDSLGRLDRYQFQGEGGLKRLIEHTRPDGTLVRYDYDAAGRQVSQTDPLGRSTYFRLDGEGRLLGLQEADGSSRSHTYDLSGQLIETTTPGGRCPVRCPHTRAPRQIVDIFDIRHPSTHTERHIFPFGNAISRAVPSS